MENFVKAVVLSPTGCPDNHDADGFCLGLPYVIQKAEEGFEQGSKHVVQILSTNDVTLAHNHVQVSNTSTSEIYSFLDNNSVKVNPFSFRLNLSTLTSRAKKILSQMSSLKLILCILILLLRLRKSRKQSSLVKAFRL